MLCIHHLSEHDKYIESLKWYEKTNVKPDFDIDEAKKISQQNDCGCNYRFDGSYIEKAILFELRDENRNSSIWFLLPDNRVLLYLMQGDRVLNFGYQEFGKSSGLQYPCVLFDLNGKIIPR